MKIKGLILGLSVLFSSMLGAAYFEQINNYSSSKCRKWSPKRFRNVKSYITAGVNNAKSFGFNYAIPITRKGVDYVWCALVPERAVNNRSCYGAKIDYKSDRPFGAFANQKAIANKYDVQFADLEDQLQTYYEYTKRLIHEEQIDRPNVGVVLELLSRYYFQELTNMYPKNRYTIASGVAYHKTASQRTIGELDIIIYNNSTCEVEVIGESKAASHKSMRGALRKAKGQLRRFRNFIQDYI